MDLTQLPAVIVEINKHIAVLNDDFTALTRQYHELALKVAVLETKVGEITWWFKTVAVAFIGVLISQIWQIILIRKNGGKK